MVLFIVAILATLSIFVFVFYPPYALQKKIEATQDEIERDFVIAESMMQLGPKRYTENAQFITDLITTLEMLPNIQFVYAEYNFHFFGGPTDTYPRKMVAALPLNEIHKINSNYTLPIEVNIEDLPQKGRAKLLLGVSAKTLLAAEKQAHFLTALFVVLSTLITYFFVYFFDKIFYFPLKRIINNSHLLAIGQQTFESKSEFAVEFNEILADLNSAAKMNMEFREKLRKIPVSYDQLKRQYEIKRKNLDSELKSLSNIVIYLLELRREKNESRIYSDFVKETTKTLGYPISIFFKYSGHQLEYSRSYLKGLSGLGKKLHKSLEGYRITEDSFIFKEVRKNNAYVHDRLPFTNIVKQFNLQGKYAFIPVSTQHAIYGLLLVGNLGENAHMEHKDIEKLMLLANTVGLHLENLDVVSNLERRIEQRTSELELTNKLLQTSNLEKDDMIKIVSHDLKAPLRNIIGLIESIERKYKNELVGDVYDRLLRINHNIEKELSIIDDTLTHYKTTEVSTNKQPVNLSVLLNSIKNDLSATLGRKNIELDIPENLPVINSHETILKHIFQNLLDNACKFMSEKNNGNRIEVEYKSNDTSKTIMVGDNGPGIDDQELENIFKSYTQIKEDDESSGLGLALVKNMLDKLGGTIYVESKLGKGTQFYVRLPHELT